MAIKEYVDSKFEVTKIKSGYAHDVFEVELLEGKWPTDLEVCELCDPGCFGGEVIPNLNKPTKQVTVWTD